MRRREVGIPPQAPRRELLAPPGSESVIGPGRPGAGCLGFLHRGPSGSGGGVTCSPAAASTGVGPGPRCAHLALRLTRHLRFQPLLAGSPLRPVRRAPSRHLPRLPRLSCPSHCTQRSSEATSSRKVPQSRWLSRRPSPSSRPRSAPPHPASGPRWQVDLGHHESD